MGNKREPPEVGTEAHRIREQLARKLFKEWTGVTHGEILAALWHNLSHDDRRYWLVRADEKLTGGGEGE